MTETIELINFLCALGGIALFFGAGVLAFDAYTKNFNLKALVARYGFVAACALTFAGSALTLLYSEVFAFVPCGLCWMQRVFLYPQVFLLGTAMYVKDKMVTLYGIVLSIFGLVVALYHHYVQMGGTEALPCPASGANCAERVLFEFGFVTFPLISAGLFAFLIALYFYMRTGER